MEITFKVLYAMSPLGVLAYLYLAYRYLYKPINTESRKLVKYSYYSAWGLLAMSSLALIVYSLSTVNTEKVKIAIHIYNFIAIIFVVFLLQITRTTLEIIERGGISNYKPGKIISDSLQNILGVLLCYTAIFTQNSFYSFSAVMLASLNIARVLVFRIYDDVYRNNIYHRKKAEGRLGTLHPGQVFLRGILDLIPRAYLYTAFSFTVFQLIMMENPLYGSTPPGDGADFNISNPSGNPFADFFYFNVVTLSTVGYGDISPVTAIAKALSSVEIIFAFIILASLFGLIIGRFQQLAWEYNENKS